MANPMRDDDVPVTIEPERTRIIDGIEVIDDEFSRLPEDERARLTGEWIRSLRRREPIDIGISAAELIAEARREEGWD